MASGLAELGNHRTVTVGAPFTQHSTVCFDSNEHEYPESIDSARSLLRPRVTSEGAGVDVEFARRIAELLNPQQSTAPPDI